MKPTFTLTLTNGYPAGELNLTTEDNDAVCERAGDFVIKLPGVVAMQQLHVLTIEFATLDAFTYARKVTGWRIWDNLVLVAPLLAGEGYGDFPAVEVNQPYRWQGMMLSGATAYCGWQLALPTLPSSLTSLPDQLT